MVPDKQEINIPAIDASQISIIFLILAPKPLSCFSVSIGLIPCHSVLPKSGGVARRHIDFGFSLRPLKQLTPLCRFKEVPLAHVIEDALHGWLVCRLPRA